MKFYSQSEVNEIRRLNYLFLKNFQVDNFEYEINGVSYLLSEFIAKNDFKLIIKENNQSKLFLLTFNPLLTKYQRRVILEKIYENKNFNDLFIYFNSLTRIKKGKDFLPVGEILRSYVAIMPIADFVNNYNLGYQPSLTTFNSFFSFIFNSINLELILLVKLERILGRDVVSAMVKLALYAHKAGEVPFESKNMANLYSRYGEEIHEFYTFFKSQGYLNSISLFNYKGKHTCTRVPLYHLLQSLNMQVEDLPFLTGDKLYSKFPLLKYEDIRNSLIFDATIISELIYHYPHFLYDFIRDKDLLTRLPKRYFREILANQSILEEVKFMIEKVDSDFDIEYYFYDELLSLGEFPKRIPYKKIFALVEKEESDDLIYPVYLKLLPTLDYQYLEEIYNLKFTYRDTSGVILRSYFHKLYMDTKIDFSKLEISFFDNILEKAKVSTYPLGSSSRNFKIFFLNYLLEREINIDEFLIYSEDSQLSYSEIMTLCRDL